MTIMMRAICLLSQEKNGRKSKQDAYIIFWKLPYRLTNLFLSVINLHYYNNNEGVIIQIKNFLSSTKLAKNTAATLNSIETGDIDKLILLKNNAPKAILMSVECYEAMEEELEDLRLTALALSRLQNFDLSESISHEEMMDKYFL